MAYRTPSHQERPKKRARIEITRSITSKSRRKGLPHPEAKIKSTQYRQHNDTVPTSYKGKGKQVTPPILESKSKGRSREEADHDLPSTFKVVAGSYEKLLYGLQGSITLDDDSNIQFHLKPMFIFPAHVSCIKAVAASPQGGKWLATGSADEIIKVWDLRRRKEIGGLMHHEGSITHLLFPSRSHLLSASEDGTLCLFRARDWAVLRSLKGHKGRVNSVAVHPSGKVALSVGKDRALRMWDLMRGRGCASTKLGKEGEIVRWSTTGSKFVVQSGSTIDVYATSMELLATIKHSSRLHDVIFCKRVDGSGEVLLAGAEDHKVSVYHISDVPDDSSPPKIIAEMVGHSNRVKAIQTLDIALPAASGRKSTTIVCTVSSDGHINIYDMAAVPPVTEDETQLMTIQALTSYDSKGTRLTCVTLADGDIDGSPVDGTGKRKRGEDNEDDEQDSGDEAASQEGEEEEEEGEEEGEDEEEVVEDGGESD